MHIFELRDRLIADYNAYISSFFQIRNAQIRATVEAAVGDGLLWPETLIQLNPAFAPGAWIDDLVAEGVLHAECQRIFRKDKDKPAFHPATDDLCRLWGRPASKPAWRIAAIR